MKEQDANKALEAVYKLNTEIAFAAEDVGVSHATLSALYASMDFAMRHAPTAIRGLFVINEVLTQIIDRYDDHDDEA
jgi:hypothetical protein